MPVDEKEKHTFTFSTPVDEYFFLFAENLQSSTPTDGGVQKRIRRELFLLTIADGQERL